MPDIENWIRLAKLESPKNAAAIVDYFGSPDDAFHAKLNDFIGVKGISRRTAEKLLELADTPVDRELNALDKLSAKVVTYKDPEYPANLRQIPDPPVVLFVRGDLLENDRFSVAIIGTRKPSEYGKSMAFKISRDLSRRGLTVISGGARGIDTLAHHGTLDGGGRTIAVMGSGLDVPYPYENKKMFEQIAETGAVISEYVPGTKPDAWRFPVRNRIVSGMSMGVLVVESLVSGGAMITATIAAEQGRDVWAIPGATDTAASQGPHLLIKEGAKLVESVDDILDELGIEKEPGSQKESVRLPGNLTMEQKSIIQVLSLHPKHADDITSECNLTPASANSNLTLLEMLGLVRRVPGNAYVRVV
ncbi:MAG: DNA-processing protein DprA [Armatimonadota bacterium]